MQTGENEQALRKIIDFTRLLSIAILIIHFYLACYPAFAAIKLTHKITDHILLPLSKMGIFKTMLIAKGSALLLLIVSLVGSKGKKDEKIRPKTIVTYCVTGLLIYFVSNYLIGWPWLGIMKKLTMVFHGKLTRLETGGGVQQML